MATKKKTAAKKSTTKAKKTARKKTKKEEPVEQAEPQQVAADSGLLPKIQCFSAKKKIICANLLLDSRKCAAKMIANGRLATVNVSKKRRCDFYEETAFTT